MINSQHPNVEFTAQDRCDRCSAQAYACASIEELELFFCGHHIKKYAYVLELEGWTVAYDYVGLEKIILEYKVPV